MSDNIPSDNKGESNSYQSRRSLLKTGVVTASVSLLPTVVGATGSQPTNEERARATHERAVRIKEKTGSRERMKQYLKENADWYKSVPHKFTLKQKDDSSSDDGMSTQSWKAETFNNSMTLTYYTDCASDPYANIHYDIYMDTDTGLGEDGPDQISLSWNDSHFRYNEGTANFDSDMDNFEVYDEELNGVDFQWYDGYACSAGCSDKDFWVACDAELLTTDQERAVQGEYHDMHEDAEVCSFSIDSDGTVGFTFCTAGKWDEYGRVVKEGAEAYNGCL